MKLIHKSILILLTLSVCHSLKSKQINCSLQKDEIDDTPIVYNTVSHEFDKVFKEFRNYDTGNQFLMDKSGNFLGCDLSGKLVSNLQSSRELQRFEIVPDSKNLGFYALVNVFHMKFVEFTPTGGVACTGTLSGPGTKITIKRHPEGYFDLISDLTKNVFFTAYPISYEQRIAYDITDFFPPKFCTRCETLSFKIKGGTTQYVSLNGSRTTFKAEFYVQGEGNYLLLKKDCSKIFRSTPDNDSIRPDTDIRTIYSMFRVIIDPDSLGIILQSAANEKFVQYTANNELKLTEDKKLAAHFEKNILNLVPGQPFNSWTEKKQYMTQYMDPYTKTNRFMTLDGKIMGCGKSGLVQSDNNFLEEQFRLLPISPLAPQPMQFNIYSRFNKAFITVKGGKITCDSTTPNPDTAFEFIPNKGATGTAIKAVASNQYLSISPNSPNLILSSKITNESTFFPTDYNYFEIYDLKLALPANFCTQCDRLYLISKSGNQAKITTPNKTRFRVKYFQYNNEFYLTLNGSLNLISTMVTPMETAFNYTTRATTRYNFFKIIKKGTEIALQTNGGKYVAITNTGTFTFSNTITNDCLITPEAAAPTTALNRVHIKENDNVLLARRLEKNLILSRRMKAENTPSFRVNSQTNFNSNVNRLYVDNTPLELRINGGLEQIEKLENEKKVDMTEANKYMENKLKENENKETEKKETEKKETENTPNTKEKEKDKVGEDNRTTEQKNIDLANYLSEQELAKKQVSHMSFRKAADIKEVY